MIGTDQGLEAHAARNGAGASRQKVMRLQPPDQFRGPLPSLLHLSGIAEGESLRQGLVERGSFGGG
jgi:hypothetical protein